MLETREACFNDVPALLRLCKQMHAESRYASISLDEAKLNNFLEGLVRSPMGFCLVGCRGGEVIALLGARVDPYFFSQELIAVDYLLYVLPEFRGSRLVIRLVRKYKEWAENKGVREIMLSSTTGYRMEKVEALYQHAGFMKAGVVFKLSRGG